MPDPAAPPRAALFVRPPRGGLSTSRFVAPPDRPIPLPLPAQKPAEKSQTNADLAPRTSCMGCRTSCDMQHAAEHARHGIATAGTVHRRPPAAVLQARAVRFYLNRIVEFFLYSHSELARLNAAYRQERRVDVHQDRQQQSPL